MASGRGRTTKERAAAAARGERFPEGPGASAKRGDPPLEEPRGERSRHGRSERPPAEEEEG